MHTDRLDPEVAAVAGRFDDRGVPPWHELSVPAARRLEDDLFSGDDTPPVDRVREVAFAGPHGDVPLRVYSSDDASEAPVLVLFHGGGWTLGTLDSIDGPCRELADRTGAVVVSVDYRLAPEHPFPTAVDEATAAVDWVSTNAVVFGGDPARLGVIGTSAGGNLAAVTALRDRAEETGNVSGQFLLYPMLDRDQSPGSYADNANSPFLTPPGIAWFWEQYLRSPVDAANPYAAPLQASSLQGLPGGTVVTAGHDPLRDEGVGYADRLDDAGVAVTHRHYPGMAHGFLSLTDSVGVAETAMEELASDIISTL